MKRSLAALLLLGFAGCSKPPGPAARPPAPVTVAPVIQKDLPVQVRVIGNVLPITSVGVKSLVTGELFKVSFQEGQDVQKDAELFEIDPRPFQEAVQQLEATVARDEALVNQSEANIARDAANAKNADADARRYADLFRQGIVSQQQADFTRTSFEALEAQVKADRAALENSRAALRADRANLEKAKLDLSYCTIRAPLDGRTGSLLVQKGNVVKANDVPLLVINQIQPIYVNFAVPEQHLAEIKRQMGTGKLGVKAVIPGQEQQPEEGTLTFVDNAVDTATGTIRLKGTFPNPQRRLWPGQFVNVVLTLSSRSNAVVVPSQAVQTGQQGPFVFVIKSDQTAESRPVTPGFSLEGETVIEKGVQPGEQVVTDGHLGLIPGAKVVIKGGGNRQGAAP